MTPLQWPMSVEGVCRFGTITASDRASSGEYDDLSGPAIVAFLEEAITSEWEVVTTIVADEGEAIEKELIRLCDEEGCSVVITTGGTGPSPRDITPEATESVCDRILPGFGEQMRSVSMKHVPTAMLSRQTAGIRGSTGWATESHVAPGGSGEGSPSHWHQINNRRLPALRRRP